MMLTPLKTYASKAALPYQHGESFKIALLKSLESDTCLVMRKAEQIITREKLTNILEKMGINAGDSSKVVNNPEFETGELYKVIQNIDSVFSKNRIKPSEWFTALKYTEDLKSFTGPNLEKLEKIDFSGLKGKAGAAEKLLILRSIKSADDIEFVLKTLEPMKNEIGALDLASFEPDMTRFLKETVQGKTPVNISQYISLARAKRDIKYPHYFFTEQEGKASNALMDYDLINKALFGSQPDKHKNAAQKLFKETGVTVHLDNNLDVENIEYAREFINITRASGDEAAPHIYITNLLPKKDNGLYAHGDAIFSKPIINVDGVIKEERLSTLAHENGHYLDYTKNKNDSYAQSAKKVAQSELESGIAPIFVSRYALKNREEYIAEVKKLAFESKILKYVNKKGQTVYRRYFSEPVTPEIEEQMQPHFAYFIRKYKMFNGPEIRNSIQPVPSSVKYQKNYIEVTQREVDTALPPDFY